MLCADALVVDVGFGGLLVREVGKRVVFDEGNAASFGREGEADGADAGVEFEDAALGRGPAVDFVEHLFKKGKVRLGKGSGMKRNGRLIERLPKEGLAVDEAPGGAEDRVGSAGLHIEPDGVPQIVFEETVDKGFGFVVCIDDEGELDAVCGAVDKKLEVAEAEGGVLLQDGDGAVDGGMVDKAMGNGDDVVSVAFKEADLRAGADSQFGFEARLAKTIRDERGLDIVRAKEEKRLLPNGGIEVGDGAAGAERKMGACGGIVHNLFTRCSRVVEKGVRC